MSSPLLLPYSFLGLLLFFLGNGCVYYQPMTVQKSGWNPRIASESQSSVPGPTPNAGSYPAEFIAIIQEGHHYQLVNFTIEGEVLSGTLIKAMDYEIPDKASFSQQKIWEPARPTFLQTLFVWTSDLIAEGPFSVAAAEVSMARYQGNAFAQTYQRLPIDSTADNRWEVGMAPLTYMSRTSKNVGNSNLPSRLQHSSSTAWPQYVEIVQGNAHYRLLEHRWEGDTISGTLIPWNSYEIPDKQVLSRRALWYQARPTLRKTLFITSNLPLEAGPFSMQVSPEQKIWYRTHPTATAGASVVAAGTYLFTAMLAFTGGYALLLWDAF